MPYAKLKRLCDTVSRALTDNTKYIPENSTIYQQKTTQLHPLTNLQFSNYDHNHNLPEDLKTFEPVTTTNLVQKYIGNCKSCNN
jgi:hypothetical protein